MAIANITGNILTDTGVAISSLVSGTGTTNYVPKFTGASTLGNSLIFDNGTNVGIGTSSPIVSQTGLGLQMGDGTNNVGFRYNIGSGSWGYTEYYQGSTAKWITGYRDADGSFNIKTGTNLSTGSGMSIQADGRLNLGHSTTNLDTIYSVNGSASPYGMNITFSGASPNNTTNNFLYFADYLAVRFKITANGNAYNQTGTYTSGVSDIRYKEQVTDAKSQWDDIKNLRVVNFKFIKDVEENGENALRQIGFIAQEVEQVSPNLIDEMSDYQTGETWKTIKTSIIHTKAIKALQEAMLRIEQLEAKVSALENKS